MSSFYDPTSESTNKEQLIAAVWECLRRNEKFRSVAGQWLASEEFRFAHASSAEYRATQMRVAQCALDWMLTTNDRLRLAEVQIEKLHWSTNPDFNFGPILPPRGHPSSARSKRELQRLLRPAPLANPPEPLTIDQSWNQVPEQFKAQFRHAHFSREQFGEMNTRIEDISKVIREMPAKLLNARSPYDLRPMANALGRIGLELNELANLNKVFKIPWSPWSNARFQEFLDSIQKSFSDANLLVPTKRYDAHASYLGTVEDWRWFLEAERQSLNIYKSADLRKLATQYSEDLRQRAVQGKAPRRAKPHGFTGEKIPSKVIKNRQSTVKRHVRTVESWIESAYPPKVTAPLAF